MTLIIPDAYEHAIDKPPFSNSDDGYEWMDNYCGRCLHDGCGNGKDDPQCPLILVALLGRTPAEWMRQPPGSPDRFHCVYFRDRDDPGGFEPEPVPDPPGQLCLLPREPFEGVRMRAAPVADVPAGAK